jgi:1-acyl-sn-glycerol-3-phosphate acyltransferase
MEGPVSFPVPWDLVFGLSGHIRSGTRRDLRDFTARIVGRMPAPPQVHGLEHLPDDPRFVLVANHFQRKGVWILHTAAALTQAVLQRYPSMQDPPVRWMVTANWPPLKIGPWKLPSPGDWLLPRVAHALHCYPVTFAGGNPLFTARTIRQILQDAPRMHSPLGIFPEGVAGKAGEWHPALPGVDRLLVQLAKRGLPIIPALAGEHASGLTVRFGPLIRTPELLSASDAAALAMARVRDLSPDC